MPYGNSKVPKPANDDEWNRELDRIDALRHSEIIGDYFRMMSEDELNEALSSGRH